MLHKHYMRAHVWLRVLIFGFTLAAAVCMGLNKQTSLVAGYHFEASYKSSPTFKFFVIGNSITCGCTLFSVFFITNLVEGYLFHLFDLVLMGLVMASAASTTAIAYVGKKGNENIGWNMVENTQSPVCNESGNSFSCSPSRSSEMDGSAKDAFSVEFEFEYDDIDDDLDPAIKEELDRPVV